MVNPEHCASVCFKTQGTNEEEVQTVPRGGMMQHSTDIQAALRSTFPRTCGGHGTIPNGALSEQSKLVITNAGLIWLRSPSLLSWETENEDSQQDWHERKGRLASPHRNPFAPLKTSGHTNLNTTEKTQARLNPAQLGFQKPCCGPSRGRADLATWNL